MSKSCNQHEYMRHNQQVSPLPSNEELATVPLGEQLRILREHKGLTIEEVSKATHISCSNLLAIEAETFENLPADTFVKGLVTLYGNFLGINGAKTAVLFLQQRDQMQPRGKRKRFFRCSSNALAPKKLAEPSHISSATLAAILLLIIIFSFTSFCAYTGWNPFAYFLKDTQPAVLPLSETIAREPDQNTTIKTTAKLAEKRQKNPYMLTATFTRDTGVDIIIDGNAPVHLQGVEGKQLQWQAGKSIRLFFDQPESAKITVNNAKVDFPTHKKDGKLTLVIPEELPNS